MKQRKILLAFLIIMGMVFIATSCLDEDDCPHESHMSPEPYYLKIIDEEGTNLISDVMFHPDSIKLYYHDNLGKTIVKISFLEGINGNILTSAEIPHTILETAINVYYLYLNEDDTDTLNVNVKPGTDGCNTWYYYTDCKYNEAEIEIDPESFVFVVIK